MPTPRRDLAQIRLDNALRLFVVLVRATVKVPDVATLRGLERRFAVRLQAGRPLVHIYSETAPGDGFVLIEPDLEDVYFREIGRGSSAVAA